MKRLLSVLTVVCMVLSLCTAVGFAANYDLVLDDPTLTTVIENSVARRNVTISGTFEGAGAGQAVVIGLFLGGDAKATTADETDGDGKFEKVFAIPDDSNYYGEYTVVVNAYLANAPVTQTFEMTQVGLEANLKSISAKGVTGTVTEGLSPVANVTVPGTTDLSAIALTFTLSTGATAKIGSTTLVSGVTEIDFTNPQTLTVTSETGTVTKTYTVGIQKEASSTPESGSTVTNPSGGTPGGSTTVVTPLPVIPPPPETDVPVNFTDLGSAEWARESIVNLAKRGVISGYSDTIFAPDGLVTREEYAKMLVLAFDLKAENATCSFSDVSAGDWYYEYVAIASARGVVNGLGDGSFGVGSTITRQDMAVMTYRAAMAQGKALDLVNEPVNFADTGDIATYAIEAVTVMQRAGIINGMGGNRFEPTGTATRAQAARIIDLATR